MEFYSVIEKNETRRKQSKAKQNKPQKVMKVKLELLRRWQGR
jgi:hypothetical protein